MELLWFRTRLYFTCSKKYSKAVNQLRLALTNNRAGWLCFDGLSTFVRMCLARMHSRLTTKSPWIGPVPFTADSPWTVTTPRFMSTSPCLAKSSVPSKNSVIPSPNAHSMLLTNVLSQFTAQSNNSNQPPSPQPNHYTLKVSPTSNPSMAPSSSTAKWNNASSSPSTK